MLYVKCRWLYILGRVDAILGIYVEHFGLLGFTLGPSWVMSRLYCGHCGMSWGYLGPPWSLRFRVYGLSFGGWGLIITTHTSLKCKHRSRPTPVQRKHSLEKRRCYQALTSHTLWTCNKRSRPTPVQRKRSHDITQVQNPQSVSAATEVNLQ